ncbi:hypothetical protein AADZ90_015465 [Aestuariibius sp. 2305UL40-4]|uniref:hypothetical protein n=1 Tax=Aestuariibius violaceus TaxID=3234132 RepID=UPI00345EC4DD
MKAVWAILAVVVVGVAVYLGVALVDVDQTQEAQLPDVDVTVEGGQAPEFDVDTGEIETGTTTVEVPTLEIERPAEDSPDNDVDTAENAEN